MLAVTEFEKYTVFLWELIGPQKRKYTFCLHRIFYRIPRFPTQPYTLLFNRPSPKGEVFFVSLVHGPFESGPPWSDPNYRPVVQSLDSIEP